MKTESPLTKAFLIGGACFLLLIRLAGADEAYGVPTSSPPTIPGASGSPAGNQPDSKGSAQEMTDVQSRMADLESKYKTETAEADRLVRDRYLDNLKQLMQSEIDKGDAAAAAAIKRKLDNLDTRLSPVPKPLEIVTTPMTATQGSGSPGANSPEVYQLRQLRVKYKKDTTDINDPQELASIQSRYHDLFKQLLQKEMLKGDESGALAVKLEMLKTRPGYPFTRRWAAHGTGGGYSLIQFKTDGNWTENTNGAITRGQWHADDTKNAVVNFSDNSTWRFQLNEAGHLIRNDGLDYGPDDKIRAYVPQAADGSLILGSDDADIIGTHLQKEVVFGMPPALNTWTDVSESLTWQVRVQKPGTYRVVFNYALAPEGQGSVVVLSAGPEQLTLTPTASADWVTFRDKDAGQITLKAGPMEIDLTALDKPGGGVMNLRSITFVPVDQTDQ